MAAIMLGFWIPYTQQLIRRGDTKDPGPDQFLTFGQWDYEVWQLVGEGRDPRQPRYGHFQTEQRLHKLHLPVVSFDAALR